MAGKLPAAQVFRVPEKTADMLKADLEAVKIPYVDDAGRYADFHALRHSTGSLLAASGAHPKVVQSMMRHSDINLTMNRDTHIFRGQESEAVAGLPDLSLPSKEKQRAIATGTDNMAIQSDAESILSTCLAISGTINQNQPEKTGLSGKKMNNENAVCKTGTAFLAVAPVAQLDRASVYGTVIPAISTVLAKT